MRSEEYNHGSKNHSHGLNGLFIYAENFLIL